MLTVFDDHHVVGFILLIRATEHVLTLLGFRCVNYFHKHHFQHDNVLF